MFWIYVVGSIWYNHTKQTATVLPHCSPLSRQVLGIYTMWECLLQYFGTIHIGNKFSPFWAIQFPSFKKYYKEGRVGLEVFKILVSGGLLVYGCHFLCVIVDTIGKCYTVNKCKDYTDLQTKSLSQMFTKTRKIFHK